MQEKILKIKKKLNNHIFILTHDPILNLLQNLKLPVMILKGHSHHEEISLKTLKSISHWLETSPQQVVWILEDGIRVPSSVQKLIKPQHQVLHPVKPSFEKHFIRIKRPPVAGNYRPKWWRKINLIKSYFRAH